MYACAAAGTLLTLEGGPTKQQPGTAAAKAADNARTISPPSASLTGTAGDASASALAARTAAGSVAAIAAIALNGSSESKAPTVTSTAGGGVLPGVNAEVAAAMVVCGSIIGSSGCDAAVAGATVESTATEPVGVATADGAVSGAVAMIAATREAAAVAAAATGSAVTMAAAAAPTETVAFLPFAPFPATAPALPLPLAGAGSADAAVPSVIATARWHAARSARTAAAAAGAVAAVADKYRLSAADKGAAPVDAVTTGAGVAVEYL